MAGPSLFRPTPPDRWALGWHGSGPGQIRAPHGAWLSDPWRFDPEAFGMGTAEARSLDPQQRLLLTVSAEALAQAGPGPTERTGVFVGLSTADHQALLARRGPLAIGPYDGTGSIPAAAAGRLAFQLNLRGPTFTVDSACSSGLVALHQACRALSSGECDRALVGAAQLQLDPEASLWFDLAGALSPSGDCRAFAASADGTVRGEGVLALVLEADRGQPCLGRLAASAVMHQGRGLSFTAPSGPAQAQLHREVLRRAGRRPEEIALVEAHATGTALGDPIEAEALAEVYGGVASPPVVGALKRRFGHTEAASGLLGVARALLALRDQTFPGDRPLPEPPWAGLRVATAPVPLVSPWAVVVAYGFTGTLAAVVLEGSNRWPAPATPSLAGEVLRGVSPPPAPGDAPAPAPSPASFNLEAALTEILGQPPRPDRPLVEQGLDSLGAVELRRRAAAATGRALPAGWALGGVTLAELKADLDHPDRDLEAELARLLDRLG